MEAKGKLARSVRMARIQQLLHKSHHGLTTRELAEACEVSVRTIQRDIIALELDLGVPLIEEGYRYKVFGTYPLPPVSFTLYEAMTVLLAARFLYWQTRESNPHINQALAKIATILPEPIAQKALDTAACLSSKPSNPDYIHSFETVILAWATQRRMRFTHLEPGEQDIHHWQLEPYSIDVVPKGYASYVIGHANNPDFNGIRVFRVARITRAELLDESFQIPIDFDPSTYIENMGESI